jgi:EmrB/QacA subfamily drug resistance transporter
MYTLEDDQETSSRLRKRDFASAATAPPGADTASAGTKPAHAHQRPSLSEQVTGSFKKLTTPAQAQAGGRGVALAALTMACVGVFFTALDQTVVVTALPQIVTDLQIPITQLDHAAWIVSAYLLGFIIAMPLMGRVSDIYGRRRIFLLCLIIFGIGSIFCGIAPVLGQIVDLSFLGVLHIDTSSPGLVWLIAARFFQAIGGGALVPIAMAVASDFYGQARRGLALGVIGAVTEAGGALGPLYGALIVQHFGWQFIFFFNVPIVIGLIIAAWFLVPRGTRLREGIDWAGAILLGLALTCLSLGLAQQGTELGPAAVGAHPQNNPISLGLAVLFLIAFVLVERKVRWPVVDLSLYKRFPFAATSLVSLFVGAALIIAMADIPIFVDTVLQRPVLDSGLALLRLTAMIPVGALLGGWLCSRISCRFTGALGLIFTAAGFYLMSRWPINVDWNQITISTVTAGLGFGLVIAPIGTTAINAVRATQAGVGSAVITALRMVGMMLGLAALTSWALAYFKQLASTYPTLPTTATSDQFAQWSKGYAHHLIVSAHTVYSAVFFTSMVLCLIAIIPAIFLWGRAVPEDKQEGIAMATTDSLDATSSNAAAAGTVAAPLVLPAPAPAGSPPASPTPGNGGQGWRNWRDLSKLKDTLRNRRRLLIAIASIGLVLLLMSLGIFAALTWESSDTSGTGSPAGSTSGTPGPGTPTPIAGLRMIELALDSTALTSLFSSELGVQQGVLTDMRVVPMPNDGIILSLNLHIDANGIHRVMPVELDSTIGVDSSQNIQLHVFHLKRDGLDAGATAAANMQKAINQLLLNSIMPNLRGQLKSAKLISAHTSSSVGCGGGAEMLVLLIQAPPIQGIAAQPTPTALCFKGPIDPSKLFPN